MGYSKDLHGNHLCCSFWRQQDDPIDDLYHAARSSMGFDDRQCQEACGLICMRNSIRNYFMDYPPAAEILKKLELAGNVILIGGALREFLDHSKIQDLRDIDIIVDVKNEVQWSSFIESYSLRTNRFGGHKIFCKGLLVDVWRIEQTWAFRENIISCSHNDYIRLLPKTVFLNLDSIVYDWTSEKWYKGKYLEGINSRVIDVVLEKNPCLLLNIARAFALKDRYRMSLSPKLSHLIIEECKKQPSVEAFAEAILAIQRKRYYKSIFSKGRLLEDISLLSYSDTKPSDLSVGNVN